MFSHSPTSLGLKHPHLICSEALVNLICLVLSHSSILKCTQESKGPWIHASFLSSAKRSAKKSKQPPKKYNHLPLMYTSIHTKEKSSLTKQTRSLTYKAQLRFDQTGAGSFKNSYQSNGYLRISEVLSSPSTPTHTHISTRVSTGPQTRRKTSKTRDLLR